jgi:uncharacterized protein
MFPNDHSQSSRSVHGFGVLLVMSVLGAPLALSACQLQTARSSDEKRLGEYAGVYRWDGNAFLYLQLWNEFTGKNELVAFDESGEVRTLYPTNRDQFFAGPGAALNTPVESRIEFQRDGSGKIVSLMWQRDGATSRLARRVEIERRHDVVFSNGDVRLAGTLITPDREGKHPTIILVHGSGPANRESMLPFARFLVRHGVAVFGYDKRGVGASTGEWNSASFDDLAGDAVAAIEYLKRRDDVDSDQIGLLGVSQAGWIMPLAAVRTKGIAFLISVSGAGIPAAETTVDHAQNEMTAKGMKPQVVAQIVEAMKRQYHFAKSGQGWNEYAAARETLAARLGRPPDTFPGTPDHPYWQLIRRQYFYDPAPTLRRLEVPTLALFGALDNNILAEKNKAAWDSALRAAGNRDYTSLILPKANHIQLEAIVGDNAEMASLRRFVPQYSTAIREWLAPRIRGFSDGRQ